MNNPTAANEVYKNDRAHVVHSWSVQSKLDPMVVDKAEGFYFRDASEKQYLDMVPDRHSSVDASIRRW